MVSLCDKCLNLLLLCCPSRIFGRTGEILEMEDEFLVLKSLKRGKEAKGSEGRKEGGGTKGESRNL